MTGKLGAEDIVAVLNEHMTALTRVVYEHHGVVDKFVGDLVMAVFGAPKSYGTDALNAVRCAEAMVSERARLNENARHPLAIGVSVATGHVVAGCTGSSTTPRSGMRRTGSPICCFRGMRRTRFL
jgi:class 3 adenylate cyclase